MGPGLRRHALPIIFSISAALFAPPMVAFAQTQMADARENMPAPGERALVARLMAPCCWQQTLDVHTGPIADDLRAEIRRRLWAGETAGAIEADLEARYGARVRAVPDGNPIVGVSLGIAALSLLVAGGLFLVIRKWRRAAQAKTLAAPSEAARDDYDDRIDDELRAMSS